MELFEIEFPIPPGYLSMASNRGPNNSPNTPSQSISPPMHGNNNQINTYYQQHPNEYYAQATPTAVPSQFQGPINPPPPVVIQYQPVALPQLMYHNTNYAQVSAVPQGHHYPQYSPQQPVQPQTSSATQFILTPAPAYYAFQHTTPNVIPINYYTTTVNTLPPIATASTVPIVSQYAPSSLSTPPTSSFSPPTSPGSSSSHSTSSPISLDPHSPSHSSPSSSPPLSSPTVSPRYSVPSPVRRRRPSNNTGTFYTNFQALLKQNNDKSDWKIFSNKKKYGGGDVEKCSSERPPCIRAYLEFCLLKGGDYVELMERPEYKKLGKQTNCSCDDPRSTPFYAQIRI